MDSQQFNDTSVGDPNISNSVSSGSGASGVVIPTGPSEASSFDSSIDMTAINDAIAATASGENATTISNDTNTAVSHSAASDIAFNANDGTPTTSQDAISANGISAENTESTNSAGAAFVDGDIIDEKENSQEDDKKPGYVAPDIAKDPLAMDTETMLPVNSPAGEEASKEKEEDNTPPVVAENVMTVPGPKQNNNLKIVIIGVISAVVVAIIAVIVIIALNK